jgi:hypothetical protein
MPSDIKKFNLTYAHMANVFGLAQEIFFNELADTIPAEAWKQTDPQKDQIQKTVDQFEKDVTRASYVDIEQRLVSHIKNKRLVTEPNGELALAPGVYPDFSQGSDTGRTCTESIYTFQYRLPLHEKDISIQLPPSIGFVYINNDGQPAGFSLLAEPTGEHQGWILATIQNATARPEERAVTVLATPNYVTSKAQSIVSMDNLDTIEKELKAAICHDKIAGLIKDVFNEDGSLNAASLAELKNRLPSNANLDDRDRKEAQLQALFSLANTRHDKALHAHITSMEQAITDDINFFKTSVFEPRLHELLHKFTSSEDKRILLKQAAQLYADIEMLAEEHLLDTEKSYFYKKLAEHIKAEIQLLTFDNTPEDNARLTQLNQLKSSNIEKEVEAFYKKSGLLKIHKKSIKHLNDKKKNALDKLDNPTQTGFFGRNIKAIGYSTLIGSLIGLTLGLALIASVLPPLAIALFAVGTAMIVSVGLSTAAIYTNEQTHKEKTKEFGEAFNAIAVSYDTKFMTAEQRFQNAMDGSIFLTSSEPELKQKSEPSPPQPLAENRFILWNNAPENSERSHERPEPITSNTHNKPPQK